jgi:hypothetical protein
MRRLVAILLGACLVLTPRTLPAQPSDAELAQGLRQVREGDFEGAVTTLESVVRRLSTAPERSADLVRAYVGLGVAYVALDQPTAARARFRDALARDRHLKLSASEHSPKVLAVFEEARREWRRSGGGGGGARIPLIVAGVAAAAAGVVLATRGDGGSGAPPAFSGARFAPTVVVCPDGSVRAPLPVFILVEAEAGSEPITISASTTLRIVASPANPAEVGFADNRPSTVTPPTLAANARSTLRIETSLLCSNGAGDEGRFNEWVGLVTFTTPAGVLMVETGDRLQVNIP